MFLPEGAENRNKLVVIRCVVATITRVVRILTHWKSENCYSSVTSYGRPFKNGLPLFFSRSSI